MWQMIQAWRQKAWKRMKEEQKLNILLKFFNTWHLPTLSSTSAQWLAHTYSIISLAFWKYSGFGSEPREALLSWDNSNVHMRRHCMSVCVCSWYDSSWVWIVRWKRRLLHHASIITSHLSASALTHNGECQATAHSNTCTHAVGCTSVQCCRLRGSYF